MALCHRLASSPLPYDMTMDFEKSRSQKKRESTALQKIGEELILLPASVLEDLHLPSTLLEAVLTCQSLPPNEARRRQTQYVGKLMRQIEEPEKLEEAINEAKVGLQAENVYFQDIERLRDRLLSPDKDKRSKALQDFLHEFPQCDANQLRSLIRAALAEAKKAQENDKPGQASVKVKGRDLFRWLRAAMAQDQKTAQ